MKKTIFIFLAILSYVMIGGCAEAEEMKVSTETQRVKLTFNGNSIVVKLNNTNISREFYSTLPLSLQFEDYVGKEKIASLPAKLKTPTNDGHKPNIGDFTYYAPWGNLAVFYQGNNSYASGLISLGKIESGLDKLTEIDGDFKVNIEKVE